MKLEDLNLTEGNSSDDSSISLSSGRSLTLQTVEALREESWQEFHLMLPAAPNKHALQSCRRYRYVELLHVFALLEW
uniref:hypothetical protein n=1 Tax=Vibrio cholerae TaxID=666 RepID=UPI003F5867CC